MKSLTWRKALGAVAFTAMAFGITGTSLAAVVSFDQTTESKAVGNDMTTSDWNKIIQLADGISFDDAAANDNWGFGTAAVGTHTIATGAGVSVGGVLDVTGLTTLNGGLTIESGDTFTYVGQAMTLLATGTADNDSLVTKGYVDDSITGVVTDGTSAGDLLLWNATNGIYDSAALATGASIVATAGDGSLSINTVQDIQTTASPTFAGLTVGTLDGIVTASGGVLSADGAPLDIANGGTNSTTALVNDFVMISSAGSIVESAAITTTELGLLDGMTGFATGAANNTVFATQGYVDDAVTGVVTSGTTAGDILVWNATNSVYDAVALATDANLTTTVADGSLTVNAIQDIQTTSSPTFAGLTLTGVTGGIVVVDGSGVLSADGTPLDIANGGTNSTTALNNDFVMVSSGGAIVESATITSAELGNLDGIVSVSSGTADNDKLVTQGYVDDLVAQPTLGALTCAATTDIGKIGLVDANTEVAACVSDGAAGQQIVYLSIFSN